MRMERFKVSDESKHVYDGSIVYAPKVVYVRTVSPNGRIYSMKVSEFGTMAQVLTKRGHKTIAFYDSKEHDIVEFHRTIKHFPVWLLEKYNFLFETLGV